MSQVYMCDMCSALFSVNQKGWKQMQESISIAENNAFNHGSRTLHICPECAPTGGIREMRPSISVATPKRGVVELESSEIVEDDEVGACWRCSHKTILKDDDGDFACTRHLKME